MSNRQRLQAVPSLAGGLNPPPLHVYSIAPRNDGLWGVWCYACSQDTGGYVYPCKVIAAANGTPHPPAVVAAPSKLAAMQKQAAADREQLETAQGALAMIAQLLGLWDNGEDVLNTKDIYDEIDRLVQAASKGNEEL